MTDPATLARDHYQDLDAGDYARMRDRLTPDFRHVRGDQTLEGRDRFVRFMRDERPETDTTHEIETVFERDAAVAVRGRLRRPDGTVWFGFVDVFSLDGDRFGQLVTYTNSRLE
jgi:ketosteroid isomerase-like protein